MRKGRNSALPFRNIYNRGQAPKYFSPKTLWQIDTIRRKANG